MSDQIRSDPTEPDPTLLARLDPSRQAGLELTKAQAKPISSSRLSESTTSCDFP